MADQIMVQTFAGDIRAGHVQGKLLYAPGVSMYRQLLDLLANQPAEYPKGVADVTVRTGGVAALLYFGSYLAALTPRGAPLHPEYSRDRAMISSPELRRIELEMGAVLADILKKRYLRDGYADLLCRAWRLLDQAPANKKDLVYGRAEHSTTNLYLPFAELTTLGLIDDIANKDQTTPPDWRKFANYCILSTLPESPLCGMVTQEKQIGSAGVGRYRRFTEEDEQSVLKHLAIHVGGFLEREAILSWSFLNHIPPEFVRDHFTADTCDIFWSEL